MVGVIGLSNIVDIQAILNNTSSVITGNCDLSGSNILHISSIPSTVQNGIIYMSAPNRDFVIDIGKNVGFLYFSDYIIYSLHYGTSTFYYCRYPDTSSYNIQYHQTENGITIMFYNDSFSFNYSQRDNYKYIVW